MRLQPIEKPTGLHMRLAFWFMRRQFGKVMTPLRVVATRMPRSLKLMSAIAKFEMKGLRLDHELHYLVAALTALINGCTFCEDIGRSMAIRERLPLGKFDALPDYRTSPLFSERERAALAYVEQATRSKHVSDETFAELRRHFDDREIVEITWVNALENYYNLINIPLGIESDGFCAIAAAAVR